jgi:hypothetical protein
MAAIYGARWVSVMGASPTNGKGELTVAGDTWSQGLAGLEPDQIAAGMRACVASAEGWPMNLPEFRAACVAAPSLAEVRQALREDFATFEPFTLAVYRRLDFWNYRRADARTADKILSEAYAEAKQALMRGEPLPQPPHLIERTPQ